MKRILTITVLSVLGVVLSAQTKIDPTVVVSNNFAGSVASGTKLPYFPANPDGVRNFDIKFDYSVFPTTYLGAYDFSPYQIEMRPKFEAEKAKHLYLRVGAGYTLRPELEFAWSPVSKSLEDSTGVRKRQFLMNVFAGHNSYIGDYHVFDALTFEKYDVRGDGKTWTWGYDLSSNLGFSLNYETLKMETTFLVRWDNVSYRNTHLNPLDGGDLSRDYSKIDNSLNVYWNIASKMFAGQKFVYGLRMDYTLFDDIYKTAYLNPSTEQAPVEHLEHDASVNLTLGGVFRNRSRLLVDLKVGDIYAKGYGNTGYFKVHPHYVFSKGRFDLDLGVSVEGVHVTAGHKYVASATNGAYIYPAAKAQFTLAKDKAFLYMLAEGGNSPARLSSLLSKYHFYDSYDLYASASHELLRNEIVPIEAKVGLKGNLFQLFDYNVYGNFGMVQGGLLWKSDDSYVGWPVETYREYMRWGAGVDIAFNYKSFKALGSFAYNGTDILKRYSKQDVFAPAQFKAYLELRYNFSERIFIAVNCDFASAQKASASLPFNGQEFLKVPAYQNLGFRAEFKTRRNIGFYIKANNLLAQPIQYVPYISEKGVSVIGGIVLTL